jgi:hypothetical protein
MGKYKMVILTNAVDGREDEYNNWYNNTHLQEVVAAPGFASAQRFKLHTLVGGDLKQKYLAIYEIDAPSPEAALKSLTESAPHMQLSDAMDMPTMVGAVFEACSDVVAAPKAKASA